MLTVQVRSTEETILGFHNLAEIKIFSLKLFDNIDHRQDFITALRPVWPDV